MIQVWHFDGMTQPHTVNESASKFKNYRHVANISVDDLEQAYYLTQHLENDWTENSLVHTLVGRCRSSMVGDIFIRDGSMYFVDVVGFREIAKET